MLRVANKGEMSVKNQGKMAGHCAGLRRHSERSRGIPMQYFTLRRGVPRLRFAPLGMTAQSVRQKSWNRSRPFLITSRLVA